ncbi:MAG: response regulator, partial [Magnetococcales bacterium]|nr:response regulator [Magnetococcales bacterium]
FQQAGNTLLDLINDILDLSKVEAGQFNLEQIPFDLPDLVDGVVQILAPRARKKAVILERVLAPDIPEHLLGDPKRLRQILVNLVGNAVKFTPQGHILVSVTTEGDQSSSIRLRFTVADTGIGIPAEKLGVIFEPFTQADSSVTRSYGGTGLGLAICHHLAQMMDGEIRVTSQEGRGSIFTFTCRFAAVREPAIATPEDPQHLVIVGKRILLMDDNRTNLRIYQETLDHAGCETQVAVCLNEGWIKIVDAMEQGAPFHALLLDYHLPEADGLQLIRMLRVRTETARMPILLLTSDDRAEVCRQASHWNVRHLVKPVRRRLLLSTLAALIEHPELPGSGINPAQVPGLRLLLAEDAIENVELIEAYLKQTRHHLTVVQNGREALARIQSHSFDLVLMDMQMPVMDGYEACRAIRAWESRQGRSACRIIALTANALDGDEEKCLQAGCDLYVSKPIKKAVFLNMLQDYAQSISQDVA